MRRIISILTAAALVLAGGSVSAWEEQKALDFITSGFWFIVQPHPNTTGTLAGNRVSGGWHGGVKHFDWWGNGNAIDHGIGAHIHSLEVTGYLRIGEDSGSHPKIIGTRDICGIARANGGQFAYRVRLRDNGEPGRRDRVGISLWTDFDGELVYLATGNLGDPSSGGGNVQLHRGNNSNTAPDEEPRCPPDAFGDFGTS